MKYRFIIAILLATGFSSCGGNNHSAMRETYAAADVKPLGGYAAYNIINYSWYSGDYISKVQVPFNDYFDDDEDSSCVFFSIGKTFFPEDDEVIALLNFVSRGNTAFISAGLIDQNLLKEVSASQSSAGNSLFRYRYRETGVRLSEALDNDTAVYKFYFAPFSGGLTATGGARIAGYNDSGEPNFLVFFLGKGRLFLHTAPRSFSNYFLLTRRNEEYLQRILEIMPAAPSAVYWDEYHQKARRSSTQEGKGFSSFSALMGNPATKNAFWICLVLLLLYLLFARKRRQRPISELQPVENSAVAFAEAIAGLYLQGRNNAHIADKLITYFYEHLRTKYFLTQTASDAEFADLLSRKTGVPAETTTKLKELILGLRANADVRDEQLLQLNAELEKFYNHRT